MAVNHGQINDFAKDLRQQATEAEQTLWQRLRNRQILNAKFRRQHPIPPYIVDFVCLEKKLIVEADGGQHAERQTQDEKRTTFLEAQGFRVLRFWNNEVLTETETVLEVIFCALNETPHPNPLPKGDE
ncbi:MAG: endonuclease domain-containing protein [Gammaproteobacteria bacterium]|nr:endonuclease domain-containing protein [Gammaproteobacteria bacterium]